MIFCVTFNVLSDIDLSHYEIFHVMAHKALQCLHFGQLSKLR